MCYSKSYLHMQLGLPELRRRKASGIREKPGVVSEQSPAKAQLPQGRKSLLVLQQRRKWM
jgi:hypothetical protein